MSIDKSMPPTKARTTLIISFFDSDVEGIDLNLDNLVVITIVDGNYIMRKYWWTKEA